MKIMTQAIWGSFLTVTLLLSQAVIATNHMTDAEKSALENAGVPIYSGATFLTSDDSSGVALWFLSSDAPDTIMDWYEENLPDWSTTKFNGVRVVYKGPAGIELEDLEGVPYVFVSSGEQLGHGPDHGNEITVRIPGPP